MSRSVGLASRRGVALSVALICLLGLQACAKRSDVEKLDARLANVESRVGKIEPAVANNQAGIAELQRRMDNLKVRPRILGRLVEGVNFDSGSAVLKDQARQVIDAFFQSLGPLEDAWVLVVGATDIRGSASMNFALGMNRANAVTKYLVTGKGIEPAFITTRTVGKSRPLGAQQDSQSLFANRRVELVVYKFVAEAK